MLLTVEEIGNIAEVTGEREGAHTFAVALETKLIEKLCAGVEMPEAVLDTFLNEKVYTADQLRAYGAACRLKALEDAAGHATPLLPRPCDCEVCDCGNSGDYARVIDWDSSNGLAKAIRALKGES